MLNPAKDNFLSISREGRKYDKNILITYDCLTNKFIFPKGLDEIFECQFTNERPLWELLFNAYIIEHKYGIEMMNAINDLIDHGGVYFTEMLFKTREGKKWFRVGFIYNRNVINITLTDITGEVVSELYSKNDRDDLTGLLNKDAFCRKVDAILNEDRMGSLSGEYAIVYFDIQRFKAINDIFGSEEGDRVLAYVADAIQNVSSDVCATSRITSDKFAFLTHTYGHNLDMLIANLLKIINTYDIQFEIYCNLGIYVTNENKISANTMIDRAILAQKSIKGSYTLKYNYYKESMRYNLLSEQEIVGMMQTALNKNQFVVYYQPQYNHSTGMIIGAEALVRWKHPERGLISPGLFIPIFEKNGFITKLDLYVFENVCKFLRKILDKKLPVVAISTNFSRNDLYYPNFVESLEAIRSRYDIDSKYLRVEITETALVGNAPYINEIIKKLHECGYIIEMDDFGSGYSSLNVLKDIEFDIIKLDMQFLAERTDNKRGGTILSSVVRMAKWLNIPVIAEGVENVNQADFLRSIGCDYVQGYLYSKPIPEEDYEKLLSGSMIGATVPQLQLLDVMKAGNFWDPKSQETLIFSNYVGGAAIFVYHKGKIEILRVNTKYLQELCMNLTEKDIVKCDPLDWFDTFNKKKYLDMLDKAIGSLQEEECETWRMLHSECCGNEIICVRSSVRLIGISDDQYLFYAMIRNITAEKNEYNSILDSEKRFKAVSEQLNVYYWEYTIATHEMRPCFRCMRDLGFPPLLRNYPESAIEAGVFPPDYADMYRDWHVQIANGVEKLEAVIPLTPDRIPFKVRYTTEFDSNGRPVKAYGSAELIVD
ncbi:MAG: bifunctional diguanylate cyclase/phosphodiesterase [Acholeplasmatales bacterium]|nr:bifunctional diguanylate cyclase/phosphodiesterase [Acholeplasmatales bacterium]